MGMSRHDAQSIPIEVDRGIYEADRAAALAGVPMRTLHNWATTGLLVPSISPERVRLWSWADLLALRIIDRLRHGDEERRRSSTRRIRQALNMLRDHHVGIDQLRDTLLVDLNGRLYVRLGGMLVRVDDGWQGVVEEVLDDLVSSYHEAPDLLQPGPRLRIVPGKLSGDPHIEGTRISTTAIFELHESGYSFDRMRSFYPEASADDLRNAVDLERRLRRHAA